MTHRILKNIKPATLGTLLVCSFPAVHADTDTGQRQPLNLGATISVQESFFAGGDDKISVRPARLNKDGFYIEGLTQAVQNGPNHTLYLGLGFDEWDYERGDSSELSDMDELDRAISVRFGGAWKLPAAVVSADLAQDVAGAHEGLQAKLRYTHMRSANTTFRPYAELQWFSADITDYYTGVDSNEITATRPGYEADAEFAVKAGFNLNYTLSPKWELVTGLHVTGYGDEITNSPIVDKDTVWGAGIGLIYQ
jgi:outer membrane scaffolding protein for murein synthesis (MipA/OmpV family)